LTHDDLDERRYSLGQIARAEGVSENTMRSWFGRGYFGLGEADRARKATGMAHEISLRTWLWIGTVLELTRYGISAARAAKIARGFALHADVDQKTGKTLRYPAELYPGDGVFTVLVAFPDDDDGLVLRVDSKTPALEIAVNPRRGNQTSCLIVWLNRVDRRVRTALEGRA
jgi:hypothetical protein